MGRALGVAEHVICMNALCAQPGDGLHRVVVAAEAGRGTFTPPLSFPCAGVLVPRARGPSPSPMPATTPPRPLSLQIARNQIWRECIAKEMKHGGGDSTFSVNPAKCTCPDLSRDQWGERTRGGRGGGGACLLRRRATVVIRLLVRWWW
jgi:hypothetical protein